MKTNQLAVKPSPGQGGAENARKGAPESERTWNVRERARAEANAGMGRMDGQS